MNQDAYGKHIKRAIQNYGDVEYLLNENERLRIVLFKKKCIFTDRNYYSYLYGDTGF